jgi:hypothetical protein
MLFGIGRVPDVLRDFVKGSIPDDKPEIADIYKVGKSMGLTKEDIIRLYYESNRGVDAKSFLARHWRIFLPVITVGAIVILFLIVRISDPWSSYPRGAMYAVMNTNDFGKRLSLSKTSSHL